MRPGKWIIEQWNLIGYVELSNNTIIIFEGNCPSYLHKIIVEKMKFHFLVADITRKKQGRDLYFGGEFREVEMYYLINWVMFSKISHFNFVIKFNSCCCIMFFDFCLMICIRNIFLDTIYQRSRQRWWIIVLEHARWRKKLHLISSDELGRIKYARKCLWRQEFFHLRLCQNITIWFSKSGNWACIEA